MSKKHPHLRVVQDDDGGSKPKLDWLEPASLTGTIVTVMVVLFTRSYSLFTGPDGLPPLPHWYLAIANSWWFVGAFVVFFVTWWITYSPADAADES